MNYKWGYITALISFAFAPLLVVLFWEEPIPSNRFYADYAGDLRDAFVCAGYFVLAGIGVAFKKSFGWYMNYIGFGLAGLFMLGVGIFPLIDVVNGGDELFWVLGFFSIGAVFIAFVVLQWRYWKCWNLTRQ